MMNGTQDKPDDEYMLMSEQFTKYVGSLLYVTCLFGTTMNILTLLQRTYNRRACSLYLLVASVCDFIHLNLGPLSNILQHGFRYDWTITSIVYCKIKTYLAYVLTVNSGTLTTQASVYQYMLSSKKSSRWNYSRRVFGIRCIVLTSSFWIIMSIPILVCSKRFSHSSHNEQLICSIPCHNLFCFFVHVIYTCLLNGLFPPLIMLIFGFLTYHNIHHLYRRSQLKSGRIRKINEEFTSMLILQSIKSTLASVPYLMFNAYWIITRNKRKSFEHQTMENFISQIVYLLFWSNYTSFFVYFYSSTIFRKQWRKMISKLICCFCKEKNLVLLPLN